MGGYFMLSDSLFSLFWNRNNRTKASIYDVAVDNNNLLLRIKVNFSKDNEDLYQISKMVVKGRDSDVKYSFNINFTDSLDNTKFGEIVIPADIFDHNEVKTWDFYLNTGSNETIRIEEFITNVTEFTDIVLNDKTRIRPYSTVRGNFSIKTAHDNISVELTDIAVEDKNTIIFEGIITGLYFDYKNIDLAFYNYEESREYKVEVNPYRDGNEFVFKKEIDLENFYLNNLEYKLYVEIDGVDFYEKIPVKFNKKSDFNDKDSYINIGQNIYKMTLLTRTKNNHLAIYFAKQDYIVDINEVMVHKDTFSIKGTIVCRNNKNLNDKFKLIIKRREGFEKIVDEIQVQNNTFSYDFPVKELIVKNELFNGVWDMYLEIDDDLYRLVSHLDGINDKRSIVQFPQLHVANKQNEIKSVKPYYTLYNDLSLLVRNYISGTRIKHVVFNKEYLEIDGFINIQVPNEDIPNQLSGSLKSRFPFGEKVELPLTLFLTKTKKKLLQFKFHMKVKLDDTIRQKLYKNISFDLLKCTIDFPAGKSTLYLNILPTLIVNNTERFIKARPRVSNLFNRLKLKSYYIMNKILPISQKTVIFQATTGMNYSCNPRAIYEEMVDKGYDIKAVWVVNRVPANIKGNPIIVKPNTLKYYYYMAIGKYFINNGNFPNFYEKRNGTVHIQTWHGTPLKKLGFDIDPSSPSYKENTSEQLMRRNRRWDYLVAPNEYTGEILQRAYLFKKKMLNVGYPRNDIFYKPDDYKLKVSENTKKYLNIPLDKKVILYAPTWRDYEFHEGQANEPYNFKFRLEEFAKKFGEDYVLLVRLHPREAVRCQIDDLENIIYNVSNYDDIKDLYLITDILITDYSSVMFDFANTRKPIVFFAHDIERYSSALRGFYFDLKKEAPGPIVKTEAELFDVIENIDKFHSLYQEQYENFYQKFCSWEDGHAAERVINAVFTDLVKRS